MNYQLGFWIITSISAGLAVAQVFRRLPSRSQKAIDRVLYLENSSRSQSQADLKRIADVLEFLANQFPESKGPYFERLLITFQEWIRR